jgi:serine/threonine protein kinase
MSIKPLYEFDRERRQSIVIRHLEMQRGGQATGPVEGSFGEIYSIVLNDSGRTRVAAKCPRIERFDSSEKARRGIELVLRELDKTHQIFMVPWINRFFDVQFIHGWPFILSRYRDGSLSDLIANPLAWSFQDRFASLIQIVRALRLAREHGISAHQDLKPDNVFFDDLSRTVVPKESKGMHFHMLVGDFGVADAFRDLGHNSGSRPYMAPEQFSRDPIDPAAPVSFDVFALGVIAFECFTNGQHPIGVTTAEAWPWRQGFSQKWKRASTWREWAIKSDKFLPETNLPTGLIELVRASLSPDPAARPSLEELEKLLWDLLHRLDSDTHAGLQMQVQYLESLSSDDAKWPHMDERLLELRQFYSVP